MNQSSKKSQNNPISFFGLLEYAKTRNKKNKRRLLDGLEINQFKFQNFLALKKETENCQEIYNDIHTQPYLPLDIDRSDSLSSESIKRVLDSMNMITLGSPIMEEISEPQKLIVAAALKEACRVGLNIGLTIDAMRLHEIRPKDEHYRESVKGVPKALARANGTQKNIKTRTQALQFLSELLKENPDITISRMASILEADSKENPTKYDKTIPYRSCLNYARSIKNSKF